MDAEWLPYAKGEAKTPVAVLQLATRTEAFLVDLLALTGGRDAQQASQEPTPAAAQAEGAAGAHEGALLDAPLPPPAAGAAAKSAGDPEDGSAVTSPQSSSSNQVTPAVEALSHFLEELLQHPRVVKLGFYMRNDLNRLQVSRRGGDTW
jgi:hypothetical protein